MFKAKIKKLIRRIIGIWLSAVILNYSTIVYAGLDALINYVAGPGAMVNVNGRAIIKDQQGGFMTGGSILVRGTKPQELQPLLIQTPRLNFDSCTGSLDGRFGAFSYISAAEFSNFFKNVAKGVPAYGVKLAVKTLCPQCEDTMSYLEQVAREINGLMINQCTASQAIVNGTLSKLVSSEKQRCMMNANANNSNKDMFETTSKCQAAIGNSTPDNPDLESLLGDNFNLVWKALSKGSGSGNNSEFKELVMSVSGTIIGRKINGRYQFIRKPSLIQNHDQLEKYIGGQGAAQVKLYKCNEYGKCLEPQDNLTSIPQNQTLYGHITKTLQTLIAKIPKDKDALNDEERALISFSSIPLFKLIEMDYVRGISPENMLVSMGEFIDVLCYDVLTNFLQSTVSQATNNVKNLEHAQIDNSVIDKFLNDAENIKGFLRDAKFGAFKKLQIIVQVKQRLQVQEKVFRHEFESIMN